MVAQLPQQQTQPLLEKRSPAKSQFLSCLAVCLATSGLLATTQATALAQSAESHMEVEATPNLVCVKKTEYFICQQKTAPPGNESAHNQGTARAIKATGTTVPQLLSPAQQGLIANILLGLGYLLPIGLGLSIYIHDRYADYRCAVLKRQIEILERIWQQSSLR